MIDKILIIHLQVKQKFTEYDIKYKAVANEHKRKKVYHGDIVMVRL